MELDGWVAIAYGLLAAVGGIMGYRQAQSKPSLISGLISGILLIVGGVVGLMQQPWGLWLAIAITVLLVVVFAIRLFKTKKFMPAGLMLGAGVVTLVVLIQ